MIKMDYRAMKSSAEDTDDAKLSAEVMVTGLVRAASLRPPSNSCGIRKMDV